MNNVRTKTFRRKYRSKFSWLWMRLWFLGYDTRSTSNTREKKNIYIGHHKNLKLKRNVIKEHHEESEKRTQRLGENICKS